MTFLGSTVPFYGGKQVANPANVIPTEGAPSSHLKVLNGTIAVDNATASIYMAASQLGGITTWVNIARGKDNFPITPYVVGPSGQAGYQTIQSAINAANDAGGGMIWIQNGTYVENLIFHDNIQIFGDSESATYIVGTHTPPSSGILNVNRVTFQSVTDVFSSTAAGTAQILIEDTTFNVTNGYSFNLPNWTGQIQLFNIGNFGTNDGGIYNTGGCTVFIFDAGLGNGNSNPMTLSGLTAFDGINVGCPVNCVTGCNFNSDFGTYAATLTFSNNSTGISSNDHFTTGATPCVTMSSSGSVSIVESVMDSSNNPCISGSGAGTLTLGGITFIGSNSSLSGSLTIAYSPSLMGSLTLGGNLNLSSTGPSLLFGSGDPSGLVTAAHGSLYLNTAGSTSSTRAFINSNNGTAWVAVTTAS